MDRELYWISCLRSVYPLGLNDKVEGFGMHGNATDVRFSDYNMYSVVNFCGRSRSRNSRNRHGRKRKGGIQGSDLVDFRNLLVSFDDSELGRIESLILSKQRRFLERFVSSHLSDGLDKRIVFLLRSRVDYSHRVRPTEKEVPSLNWSLDFQHKIFSDVNVRSILNSVGVKCLLPSTLQGKFDVKLVYKYGKTIGSKILNYNNVLKNKGTLFYQNIQEMSCNCQTSDFRNEQFGHIITGDLNVINNPKLRELCSFGTKFRENPYFDMKRFHEIFKKSVDNLAIKICQKFRISRTILKNWKKALSKNFMVKLWGCSKTYRYRQPILSNSDCKAELARLQDNFVITVVDKAAGNFAFICKKYYFLRLAEELGMNNDTPGNETYCATAFLEPEIVEKQRPIF